MIQPPRMKLIGGVKFYEGEVIAIRGVGFVVVKLTKRGLALRKQKTVKEEPR